MLKKILVVSALALGFASASAYAGDLLEQPAPAPVAAAPSNAGPYIGIEGGYVDTGMSRVDGLTQEFAYVDKGTFIIESDALAVSKDTGFGGRIFAGYQLNDYIAAEIGYTYFGNKAKVDVNSAIVEIAQDATPVILLDSYELYKVKTQAFDLMGKLSVPLVDSFNLYGKLGVAYLMRDFSYADGSPDTKHKKLCLAVGAGVDYAINQNVIINGEWFQYQGSSKLDSDYQPATNAFMVGIRYKFNI
jgi:OmpA-OmpF porin, OOP family